jgi:hypothetical protein
MTAATWHNMSGLRRDSSEGGAVEFAPSKRRCMGSLFGEEERFSLTVPSAAVDDAAAGGAAAAASVALFHNRLSHASSASQETLVAEAAWAKASTAAVVGGCGQGADNVSDTEAAEMMLALRSAVMH